MATQDASPDAEAADTLIVHTTDIVVSFVANNSIGAQEVSSLIQNVHATLAGLGSGGAEEPRPDPAVSVRASVKSDHLVCLEDGKKFKMLKRHLMSDHDMTPAEYRARWGLPGSYPMAAPDYAEKRRDLAKKIGLGRKPGERPGPRKTASKKAGCKNKGGQASKMMAAAKGSDTDAKLLGDSVCDAEGAASR